MSGVWASSRWLYGDILLPMSVLLSPYVLLVIDPPPLLWGFDVSRGLLHIVTGGQGGVDSV